MTPQKGALLSAVLLFFSILPSPTQAQQNFEVSIQNYHFQPDEIHILQGDTVKWVNNEKRTSHSVSFPVENGGESERFFPGETWLRRFDAPGTYTYHCGPHPEMIGRVVVGLR